MLLLSSLLHLLFIYSSNGDYCPQDGDMLNCTLCSQTCIGDCKNNYHCPENCSKLNNCKSCEYVTTEALCGKGCIAGYAGERCQDYCPGRCKECHQYTRKCTSCDNGGEGENCDLPSTVSSTTTRGRPCVEKCDFCQGGDMMCEECVSQENCQDICGCNGIRLTTTPKRPIWTTKKQTLMPGLPHNQTSEVASFGTLSLTVLAGLAFLFYKCRHRFQIKCNERRPRTRNLETSQGSDGSSPPTTGYVYIDADNLEACHIRPQPEDALPPRCPNDNRRSPPRCPNDNYYESIGNNRSPSHSLNGNNYESVGKRGSALADAGSESSLSTWSGTLFGNLFEINGEIADRELNQDIEIVSLEEYEMNTLKYLTPNLSINSNQGASLV